MEFDEAVKQGVALQICIPNRRRPLETAVRAVAEVFLVETTYGPAVVWLDPYWCDAPPEESCHIAYATPRRASESERWLDTDPRYGPKCLVYQKPFLMEPLDWERAGWKYAAWQAWRKDRVARCGRKAAWARASAVFGGLIVGRRV